MPSQIAGPESKVLRVTTFDACTKVLLKTPVRRTIGVVNVELASTWIWWQEVQRYGRKVIKFSWHTVIRFMRPFAVTVVSFLPSWHLLPSSDKQGVKLLSSLGESASTKTCRAERVDLQRHLSTGVPRSTHTQKFVQVEISQMVYLRLSFLNWEWKSQIWVQCRSQ